MRHHITLFLCFGSNKDEILCASEHDLLELTEFLSSFVVKITTNVSPANP